MLALLVLRQRGSITTFDRNIVSVILFKTALLVLSLWWQ